MTTSNTPRVSVIIPTYNRSKLLIEAVRSVLNQTFQDFELLIIDDGSTDDTEQRIRDLQESRIRYSRNRANSGVSASRNNGISKSRGIYIAFIDDDDQWLPEKLEKQVRVLDTSPPDVGAVCTGAVSVDIKSGVPIEVALPRYSGKVLNELLESNFISTSSIVVKRECFEKVGTFDQTLSYGEDFDMWIRLARVFLVESIPEPLIKHTDHQNATSSNNKLIARNLERIIDKHRELFRSNRKGLANYLLKAGTAYCYDGNIARGRALLLKAVRIYPLDIKLYYNIALTLLGPDMYKNIKTIKANLLKELSGNAPRRSSR